MKIRSARALADALQQIRKQQGQTQIAIGELAGTKQATVSAFETAPENARVDTLFKLLSALGLQLVLEPKGPESAAGATSNEKEGGDSPC